MENRGPQGADRQAARGTADQRQNRHDPGIVKNGGGTFDAALTLDDQFKTSFVFEPRDTPRQGKRNKRK